MISESSQPRCAYFFRKTFERIFGPCPIYSLESWGVRTKLLGYVQRKKSSKGCRLVIKNFSSEKIPKNEKYGRNKNKAQKLKSQKLI